MKLNLFPVLGLLCLIPASGLLAEETNALPKESDFYTITTIPAPEGAVIETGAIDIGPDGNVYLSTRHGEIWSVENAFEYPDKAAKWQIFARYLHEPLGLAWKGDWLYTTQRPELTRLKDEDGDGRADIFETVNSDWGVNGNYHEYAFGSPFDSEGNIYVILCLTGSFTSESLFRGWALQIDKDGKMTPFACGVRSPGGIGFGPNEEIFYTDNQGAWNGSSSLKHLTKGSFQGNPNGLVWFKYTAGAIGDEPPHPPYAVEGSRTVIERENIPSYVPPAVMFPHEKMGRSPTGIVTDETGGKFGPFEGQLFVGEQTYSEIQRVFLEEVNGVYQGAVFHFLEGFQSGNIGMRLTEDGSLFTGGSNRGWSARGGKLDSFERVNWTGKVPFEVHEMRAKPDGFELTFTEPVDKATAADLASYKMEAYTYLYRKDYGSPEVDQLTPTISEVKVAEDGKSVRLKIEPLTKGHVHELHLSGVRNGAGNPLLHDTAYYTLNEIPSK